MNTEARLDRLEKQNTILRRGLLGLLLLVLVVPLVAFTMQDKKFNLTKQLDVKELHAERNLVRELILLDENGQAVDKISGSKKRVFLQFGGRVGKRETALPILELVVEAKGTGAAFVMLRHSDNPNGSAFGMLRTGTGVCGLHLDAAQARGSVDVFAGGLSTGIRGEGRDHKTLFSLPK